MSKPVNDVRSTSFDARYAGVAFSGSMKNALKQARVAPDYGLPDEDLRAPKDMSRDRAMLLGFLRLLPESPLKRKQGQAFSILSAERPQLDAGVNATRTVTLKGELARHGVRFNSVSGCYQGTTESSFVVLIDSELTYQLVTALARRYEQESILHVDALRRASLQYFDGRRDEWIGTWTPVNGVEGHDAWTEDASGQQYVVLSQHSKYSLAGALERGVFYSVNK